MVVGQSYFCEKTRGQRLPFAQLAHLLRNVPRRTVQAGFGPINLLRALFERLRNCETGEFAIVESLLNVLATNIFQIHHGGREVLVAEPFLQFTNAADIAFQIDGRKCVPKLMQEPVAAIRPLGAAVAVPRCTCSAVTGDRRIEAFSRAVIVCVFPAPRSRGLLQSHCRNPMSCAMTGLDSEMVGLPP
jgi:hypothetical protein